MFRVMFWDFTCFLTTEHFNLVLSLHDNSTTLDIPTQPASNPCPQSWKCEGSAWPILHSWLARMQVVSVRQRARNLLWLSFKGNQIGLWRGVKMRLSQAGRGGCVCSNHWVRPKTREVNFKNCNKIEVKRKWHTVDFTNLELQENCGSKKTTNSYITLIVL